MIANTETDVVPGVTLGSFLRNRRARMAPHSGGNGYRRTPGLRREEVATRAGVSLTWYTWLEQGRGGPPSRDVLNRVARALELDAAGREALFLLAGMRTTTQAVSSSASPALQRMLDHFTVSPAIVKTPAWDILAWNAAASAVLTDFASASPRERNGLRRMFCDPALRAALVDWETDARFAIAAFRIDVARAGAYLEAEALATELTATSSDFRRLWAENEMHNPGGGRKQLLNPYVGLLTFDYATFSIDGEEGQSLIVFTPATPGDADAVARLVARVVEG